MAAWISVAASLHTSFLDSENTYSVHAPVTVTGDSPAKAVGLRLHRYTATAHCSVEQSIALRRIAEAESTPEFPTVAVLQPLTSDLNYNHVALSSLTLGAKFCALTENDFGSISRCASVQERAAHALAGTVARNATELLEPGVLPLRSWPDATIVVNRFAALPKKATPTAAQKQSNNLVAAGPVGCSEITPATTANKLGAAGGGGEPTTITAANTSGAASSCGEPTTSTAANRSVEALGANLLRTITIGGKSRAKEPFLSRVSR